MNIVEFERMDNFVLKAYMKGKQNKAALFSKVALDDDSIF